MSYHLSAVAVDLDRVRAAIGSKDEVLLAALCDENAYSLQRIDDLLENALDADDPDYRPLTAADVLGHLVLGGPYREGERVGFAYGYCLELLCHHFGEALNNSEWCSMRSAWFDAVQAALEAAGVNRKLLSVHLLANRGAPIAIPTIDDFPGIGYLMKVEIAQTRAALAAADLSRIADKEAVASIRQISAWLDECVRSNRDLVCFYA